MGWDERDYYLARTQYEIAHQRPTPDWGVVTSNAKVSDVNPGAVEAFVQVQRWWQEQGRADRPGMAPHSDYYGIERPRLPPWKPGRRTTDTVVARRANRKLLLLG